MVRGKPNHVGSSKPPSVFDAAFVSLRTVPVYLDHIEENKDEILLRWFRDFGAVI